MLDELDNIEKIFKNISAQTYKNFSLYICVNQPDAWWDDESKIPLCERNIKSMELIKKYSQENNIDCKLIDKTSKGKGWQGKNIGVGWARKTIMDQIALVANDEDIVISLDGDTFFSSNYFAIVHNYFATQTLYDTVSIPYYHPQNSDKEATRAILRYEIYMRYYFLNLARIHSPYTFSALGSAIAFRHKAINKIGGFSPKKSGEDFYFIQKMIKHKPIGNWLDDKVFPAARFSDRVYFGTGPAMIKGREGSWDSYPLYPMRLFNNIREFYDLIPPLFESNISTPIDSFWKDKATRDNILDKLRANNKDLKHFTKAIHDYFDALRILQYIKSNYKAENEEENLMSFLQSAFAWGIDERLLINLSFSESSLGQLNAIRDYLCDLEDKYRKQISNN